MATESNGYVIDAATVTEFRRLDRRTRDIVNDDAMTTGNLVTALQQTIDYMVAAINEAPLVPGDGYINCINCDTANSFTGG